MVLTELLPMQIISITPRGQSQSSSQEGKETMITVLRENDVLLGRGTGPNESQGNIRFRSLVRDTLERTCGIAVRSGNISSGNTPFTPPRVNTICASGTGLITEKTVLATEIVRAVKSRNGRFLQKPPRSPTIKKKNTTSSASSEVSSDDSPPKCNQFVEVEDDVAIEKTKQTFRHQMKAIERTHKHATFEGATVATSSKKREFSCISLEPTYKNSVVGSSKEGQGLHNTDGTRHESSGHEAFLPLGNSSMIPVGLPPTNYLSLLSEYPFEGGPTLPTSSPNDLRLASFMPPSEQQQQHGSMSHHQTMDILRQLLPGYQRQTPPPVGNADLGALGQLLLFQQQQQQDQLLRRQHAQKELLQSRILLEHMLVAGSTGWDRGSTTPGAAPGIMSAPPTTTCDTPDMSTANLLALGEQNRW